MSEVVQVQNITKTYGKKGEKQYQALKGVSFDVERGELLESWVHLGLVKPLC